MQKTCEGSSGINYSHSGVAYMLMHLGTARSPEERVPKALPTYPEKLKVLVGFPSQKVYLVMVVKHSTVHYQRLHSIQWTFCSAVLPRALLMMFPHNPQSHVLNLRVRQVLDIREELYHHSFL